MFLRSCCVLLFCLIIGCESVSVQHQTTDSTGSSIPKPILTTLPSPQIEAPNLSERMVVPDTMEKEGSTTLEPVDPFPTVYFPFDSWEITPEVRARLDATAKWMTHYSRYALTIEGHTDIRGTESYNMVLGVRRAQAVKDYLSNLGIPRNRLEIVSYGNTLVLCDVDDERKCHQYNRRADLLLE